MTVHDSWCTYIYEYNCKQGQGILYRSPVFLVDKFICIKVKSGNLGDISVLVTFEFWLYLGFVDILVWDILVFVTFQFW